MTTEELEHLARAWVRNGAKVRNWQLVSCGSILLGRLQLELTDEERDAIRAAVAAR